MPRTPPPTATTRYGRRKLNKEAFEKQQAMKTRQKGSTVYGNRKGNATHEHKRVAEPPKKGNEPRGLPDPEYDPSVERRHDADTAPGVRKGGEERAANPFAEGVSVRDLQSLLDERPELIDRAIDAEMARAEPRKKAAEILQRAERARDGGPRTQVMAVLKQIAG